MEDTIIERISKNIKPSPIIYQPEKKPKKVKPYMDGYVRGTLEQTMFMTKKYKRRWLNLVIKIFFAICLLAALGYYIYITGLINF